jgi:hypothetical protein
MADVLRDEAPDACRLSAGGHRTTLVGIVLAAMALPVGGTEHRFVGVGETPDLHLTQSRCATDPGPNVDCPCARSKPADQLATASLVFRGTVSTVEQRTERVTIDGLTHSRRAVHATFDPIERFKGPAAGRYVVVDDQCEVPETPYTVCINVCAANLRRGAEYVVFAFPSGDTHQIDKCSTYLVGADPEAKALLKTLRRLQK